MSQLLAFSRMPDVLMLLITHAIFAFSAPFSIASWIATMSVPRVEPRMPTRTPAFTARPPMSWRKCMPSKWIAPTAWYAVVSAAWKDGATAVTVSTRPPLVLIAPSSHFVPAWNTVTSGSASASFRPSITKPFL